MLDFGKLFNIISVAVAGALILFFLAVTIAVAVKGKRKCAAGDVLLRLFATIVFIAATAMFACSVLTMLEGGYIYIAATDVGGTAAAVFVMGELVVELPIAEIFVVLSSTVGSELIAALFLVSLVALIVDCLVANKKPDKKSKQAIKQTKTPEQLKREAELEKIRKIGESAVKKTNAAASSSVGSSSASEVNSVVNDKTENTKTENSYEAEQQLETDKQSETDWRVEAEQKHTSFVGIKDESDNGFDSFDTFDGTEESEDISETRKEESVEETEEGIEQESDTVENEDKFEDTFESSESSDSSDSFAQSDSFDIDEIANGEDRAEISETSDNSDDDTEEDSEEDLSWLERGNDDYVEQPSDEDDRTESEAENEAESFDIDKHLESITVRRDYGVTAKRVSESYKRSEYGYDDEHIEPNRDIYIPKMRTIKRGEDSEVNAEQSTPKKQTGGRTTKPAQKRSATTSASKTASSAKRAPTAKNTETGKPAAARAKTPAEKKLPVTRRYVILDRRNAVNMFGEYLKERNQAEKNKLESSINTIIIE